MFTVRINTRKFLLHQNVNFLNYTCHSFFSRPYIYYLQKATIKIHQKFHENFLKQNYLSIIHGIIHDEVYFIILLIIPVKHISWRRVLSFFYSKEHTSFQIVRYIIHNYSVIFIHLIWRLFFEIFTTKTIERNTT